MPNDQSQLRLGKLPSRPDAIKLKLANYVDLGVLPKAPSKAGHFPLIGKNWGMLGNDQYGCCVWAGTAHQTMLWNKEAGKTVAFDTESVLSDYSAVTGFDPKDPGSDQGTDVQIAASYWRKVGVLDAVGHRHQVSAYLAIALNNRTEVQQAVYLFSSVGIGIAVPTSAKEQFIAGKPWTVVRNSPIEGGHYVPCVGYDSKYLYVVTWGQIQRMSYGFFNTYADEAVAFLDTEMLTAGKSLDGFSATQLEQDLNELEAA